MLPDRAPTKSCTALLVVLFEPDETIEQRLQSAARQFTRTFIIDNSNDYTYEPGAISGSSVQYHRMGKNYGLATALNVGCKIALENGFDWVVTMDQDTWLREDYLSNMLHAASLAPESTALIGCNYYRGHERGCRY